MQGSALLAAAVGVSALSYLCFLLYYACVVEHSSSHRRSAVRAAVGTRPSTESTAPLNERRLTQYNITIWSSDFHIGPVADVKNFLLPYGVRFIDKSLSGHCQLTDTCQTDLHVLTRDNGITLGTCPNALRRRFYEHYRADDEFMSADAVLCTYAFASCVELFLPFNKSIIVIASTRFETGRDDARSWTTWIRTLRRVAAHPHNVVAANSKYDVEYMNYFTGIPNLQLLPSYCGYVNTSYAPTKSHILLGLGRGIPSALRDELKQVAAASAVPVACIRELYPRFEYADLAAHPAMVVFPYQVSIMSIFELYRMGVPLFVPSPELLVRWHKTHGILKERTWAGVRGASASGSVLARHAQSTSTITHLDPNDDLHDEAILRWIEFADFYVWPSVTRFDSWSHLMHLLRTSDFAAISKDMQRYNDVVRRKLRSDWEGILDRVVAGRSRGGGALPEDINDALLGYGVKLSTSSCTKVKFT